ncbi:MAG TPA: zf-HC2 domain-containing protein [Polyangia bacterium]|nr:zf-HC2 domain-containing protein [Polyangia bacterium]
MDHQQAADRFSDYLDGTLAPRDREALEAHLATCIQCRTSLTSFKRAVGSLGKLKQAAPPAFLPNIQKQIHARSRGRFFGKRWLLFGRVPFEWVSLAVIIGLLVYYIATIHGAPGGVHPAP